VEVVQMYGLTRGAVTLVGVVVAGFLLYLVSTVGDLGGDGDLTTGDYWAQVGLAAAAGLVMALSQLLGGWTKWGWPRISANVFLLAFLPALVVGGWIIVAGQPGTSWLGEHVRNWSDDIGVDGFVDDMLFSLPALAFGLGLLFGLTFDTTGPRVRKSATPAPGETPRPTPQAEERQVHIRDGDEQSRTREPEAAPKK
jgi:hypothetical protein